METVGGNIQLNIDNSINVETSTVVSTETVLQIMGTGTELKVKITADFKDIPAKYHMDYLRYFMYNYCKDYSVWGSSDDDVVGVPAIPKKGMWETVKGLFK